MNNLKQIVTGPAIWMMLAAMTFGTAAQANLRQEQPLVEQAVSRVFNATEKVVKQSPFNFDAGVCFGVAVISRGDKIQTPYALERGVRYLFIGGGDKNAQNITMAVMDSKGKVLAQDNASDPTPVVFFTPTYTGNYNLAMRLRSSRSATSFCSLVVMRKTGGYALPISSIREVSKPSDQLPAEMNQILSQLRFHRLRNQWAAFGAVLKQGDSTRVPGLKFETGNHAFIGGTDGRSTDLAIALHNASGQVLAGAAPSDASPAFAFQTDSRQTYQMTMTNRRSNGTALVFVMALDVVPGGTQNAASNVRGGITVVLNGQVVQFRSGGAIETNGRVLVPLRELFEAMGGTVRFNPNDNSFIVQDDENVVQLKVGSPLVSVNGNVVQMDTPVIIHNGTAMVPLRFFIQAAGAKVEWNGQRRMVSITAR